MLFCQLYWTRATAMAHNPPRRESSICSGGRLGSERCRGQIHPMGGYLLGVAVILASLGRKHQLGGWHAFPEAKKRLGVRVQVNYGACPNTAGRYRSRLVKRSTLLNSASPTHPYLPLPGSPGSHPDPGALARPLTDGISRYSPHLGVSSTHSPS